MSEHLSVEDLLAHLDRELQPGRSGDIEQHLAACQTCAVRHRKLAALSQDAVALSHDASRDASRMTLSRDGLSEQITLAVESRRARVRPALFALTAAILFLIVQFEAGLFEEAIARQRLERAALPDASLTPGVARAMTVQEVCSAETPRVPPAVPDDIRAQVLRDYGMEDVSPDAYELDYLITPELGGLPDRRNLWPELYESPFWNAHAKDALEHTLPRMVCAGAIDLATAQREIAANWIRAYRRYLSAERPVQLHARLLPFYRPATTVN